MVRCSLVIIISFGVLLLVLRSDIFIRLAFEQLCITGHHSVRYSSSNSCYAGQEEAFFQIPALSTTHKIYMPKSAPYLIIAFIDLKILPRLCGSIIQLDTF